MGRKIRAEDYEASERLARETLKAAEELRAYCAERMESDKNEEPDDETRQARYE